MKKAVRLFLLVTVIFTTLFLTSCKNNIGVKTEMVINNDGSGYRRMYYEYPYEDRKKLSPEKICDVIESEIDNDLMSFKTPDNKRAKKQGYYLFEIYINFDNLDEYKDKVQKILDLGNTEVNAEIELTEQKGLFSTSTGFKENFTTEQLLAFLENAGDKYIRNYDEKKYQSMHFYPENAGITVKIGDKTYNRNNTLNNAINVTDSGVVAVNDVDINVAMISDNQLSRTVSIGFSGDISKNGQSVFEYYDGLLRDEDNIDYDLYENRMVISFFGDYDRIARLTQSVLDCDCVIKPTEQPDEIDALVKHMVYNESIALPESVSIGYGIVNVDSYSADNLLASSSGQDLIAEYTGDTWQINETNGNIDVEFSFIIRTYVKSVEYKLTHLTNDRYERVIRFFLGDETENTASLLKQQFDKAIGSGYTTVEGSSVVFKMEGTIDEINSVQSEFLGSDNYISLFYKPDYFSLFNDVTINDSIYLNSNLYSIGKTNQMLYSFNPMKSDVVDSEAAKALDNCQVYTYSVKMLNSFAVYIYFCSAILIVLITLLIIFTSLRSKYKKSLNSSTPMGGYTTSDGVIIMPSGSAVPVPKKIMKKQDNNSGNDKADKDKDSAEVLEKEKENDAVDDKES